MGMNRFLGNRATRAAKAGFTSNIATKVPVMSQGNLSAPLATIPDPTVETMGKEYANYGALKALCEQAAEKAMLGRATLIRPGFIVGPDDPTGRFTYWPARFARGGEVALPGSPTDPLQLIDVRDLAEWLVRLVENSTLGRFNATGPDRRMGWGEVVKACQRTSGMPSTLTWISPAFLAKQEGLEFPIWAPYEGDTKGFHTWQNARALKAGLRFRPIAATVKDTLAWYKTQAGLEKGRSKLAGPTPEAEAKLLLAWHESLKPKGA